MKLGVLFEKSYTSRLARNRAALAAPVRRRAALRPARPANAPALPRKKVRSLTPKWWTRKNNRQECLNEFTLKPPFQAIISTGGPIQRWLPTGNGRGSGGITSANDTNSSLALLRSMSYA